MSSLPAGRFILRSSRFPWLYPNNYYRSLIIAGRYGQAISIHCPRFFVEFKLGCSKDYLSINGVRYCGLRRIPTIRSTSLALAFRTNGSVRLPGFACLITVPPVEPCCGVANRDTRIVGGVETEVSEYPWMARLLVSVGNLTFLCGGSVINTRYVLTAGHCMRDVENASGIQVLLGDHQLFVPDGETLFNVEKIIQHPSYTFGKFSYDFSLLRLSTPITFNDKIAPVCLPTSGGDFASVDAIVTGWGLTTAGGSEIATVLQEVTVQTITNARCRQAYANIGTVDRSMICAGVEGGGKDACQGDSGGPLVTELSGRYNLIGVVSWGRSCALPDFPGVYSRVTSASDWIQQNTADASLC